MIDILKKLEFTVKVGPESILVTAPTWRQDVTGPVDIAEEVSRIYGYDNIASTRPTGQLHAGGMSQQQNLVDRSRDLMTGFGFFETLSFSFSHPSFFEHLRLPDDS